MYCGTRAPGKYRGAHIQMQYLFGVLDGQGPLGRALELGGLELFGRDGVGDLLGDALVPVLVLWVDMIA